MDTAPNSSLHKAHSAPVVLAAASAAPIALSAAVGASRECRLLQGPVALSAQLVLLVVVITALSIKRHRERPRRPLNIWLLDIGKQACSSGAGHTVGMLVAIIAHGRSGQASECGWYFVVYFMDCTLGLTLAITFHKLTTGLARWLHNKSLLVKEDDQLQELPWWEALVEIGYYGDGATPNMRKWGIQVASWVLCVISARSVVGAVILLFSPAFMFITANLDARFVGRPDQYLYTVMVALPLVVNVGQAWIQDQVLKWTGRKHPGDRRDHDHDKLDFSESEGSAVVMMPTQQQPSQTRKQARDAL